MLLPHSSLIAHDNRAVRGALFFFGFLFVFEFFRPHEVLQENRGIKIFVMGPWFADRVPDEGAVRGSSPSKGIFVF